MASCRHDLLHGWVRVAMCAQEVAERRGLRVLDMDPATIRYPGYDGVQPGRP